MLRPAASSNNSMIFDKKMSDKKMQHLYLISKDWQEKENTVCNIFLILKTVSFLTKKKIKIDGIFIHYILKKWRKLTVLNIIRDHSLIHLYFTTFTKVREHWNMSRGLVFLHRCRKYIHDLEIPKKICKIIDRYWQDINVVSFCYDIFKYQST